MRFVPIVLFLCLCLLPVRADGPDTAAPGSMRVMSYNILYDSPKWGSAFDWTGRRPLIAALLHREAPDLIGFQEVLIRQLSDLQAMLPEYDYTGNVPGVASGEEMPWVMNPVFFRRDRLQVLDAGFHWLTGTDPQGVPQLGWPESGIVVARPAHAVWTRFRDLSTHAIFYHVNLHLPPQSGIAREKCAAALVRLIHSFEPERPILIGGDFNTAAEPALDLLKANGLSNARVISASAPTGPAGTKVSRNTGAISDRAIDHIFVSPGIRVEAFATLDGRSGDRHPSDHLPVVSLLTLPQARPSSSP